MCDAVISLVPGVPRWLRRCGHRTARQGKPPTSAAGICLFQCGPEPRSPFFWRKKIFTSPERTTRRPGTGGGFQAGGAQPISQAADRPIDHVSSERRASRQLRAKEKRKEKKRGLRACCHQVHESNNNAISPARARKRRTAFGASTTRDCAAPSRARSVKGRDDCAEQRGVTVLCSLSKGAEG